MFICVICRLIEYFVIFFYGWRFLNNVGGFERSWIFSLLEISIGLEFFLEMVIGSYFL